nr:response regulator transcription factor [Paenibacillus bovis]
MSKDRVLVVDDEEGIRELIQLFLQKKGYEVLLADNGYKALEIIIKQQLDVILLDVEMPGMQGFDICEQIRMITKVPVIFVSCKKDSIDRINGLKVGGDDYITKPFDFNELEARIYAVLRRGEWGNKDKRDSTILAFNQLHIHTDTYEVFLNGKQIRLLQKEYQLLLLMAKHPNRVWTAEQLYDHVWGEYSEGSIQTVKVHISKLRRKLENDPTKPEYIQTVRGFGYKFVGDNKYEQQGMTL